VSGDRPTLGIVAQSGALARHLPAIRSRTAAYRLLQHLIGKRGRPPVRGLSGAHARRSGGARGRDLRRAAARPAALPRTPAQGAAARQADRHASCRLRTAIRAGIGDHPHLFVTGNYRAMRALTARAGVVIVDKIDELLDVAELFMYFPSPPTMGRR